jgi:serine/threonine protein kinase
MIKRPKFSPLNTRQAVPIPATFEFESSPSTATATPKTASPYPVPRGPALQPAVGDDASPTPTTATPSTFREATHQLQPATHGMMSPMTTQTPSTGITPPSTEFAASFGHGLPRQNKPAAPCGRISGPRPHFTPLNARDLTTAPHYAAPLVDAAAGGSKASPAPAGAATPAAGAHNLRLIRTLDQTDKAVLKLHHYREGDANQWTLVVEKQILEKTKAFKEKQQLELKCAHPNLVKYLFQRAHRDGSLSIFIEFINMGSLRGLQSGWSFYTEVPVPASEPARGGMPWLYSGSSAHSHDSDDHSKEEHRACSRAPTPVERVLLARSIGLQILSGLQYYHIVHNRVHRDVKPGNILIKDDGRVKLCDFDAVKNTEESGATFDGTINYMAPEIAQGTLNNLDGKCDVFSVGVALYEIAAGAHPFCGIPVMRLIQDYQTVLRSFAWDKIPHSGLREVIRNCATYDHGARYTCAQALQHPFFKSSIPSLLDDADLVKASVDFEEDRKRLQGELSTLLKHDSKRDVKAEQMMKERGIEVDESQSELELSTWRAVRSRSSLSTSASTSDLVSPQTPAQSSGSSHSVEASKWLRETDDVMKRIIHLRQRAEQITLRRVLEGLGHKASVYEVPKR